MIWPGVFTSIVIPCYVGYILSAALLSKQKSTRGLSLALSFGLGLGILTQGMVLLDILNIPYSVATVGWPPLIMTGFLHVLMRLKRTACDRHSSDLLSRIKPKPVSLSWLPSDPASLLLTCYITVCVAFTVWLTLFLPLYGWDEISFIGLNAKVFFHERSLSSLTELPRANFPLLVPLGLCWEALNLGFWDEKLVKIIFPCLLLSCLGLCFLFLRQYVSKRASLLGLCLLLSSAFFVTHATIAYRDFATMYYNTAAILLLLFWYRRREDNYLILASLMAGFMTFTKLEGTVYFALQFGLLCLLLKDSRRPWRDHLKPLLKFLLPGLLIFSFFLLYKITRGIDAAPADSRIASFHSGLERLRYLPGILRYSFETMLSNNWNILFFLLVMSIIRNPKNDHLPEIKFLLMTLSAFIALLHLYLLLARDDIFLVLYDSVFNRALLHIFPLVPILIVLFNSRIKNMDSSR